MVITKNAVAGVVLAGKKLACLDVLLKGSRIGIVDSCCALPPGMVRALDQASCIAVLIRALPGITDPASRQPSPGVPEALVTSCVVTAEPGGEPVRS